MQRVKFIGINRSVSVVLCVFLLALSVFPPSTALAAPSLQTEAIRILLGEFAQASLNEGEEIAYVMNFPIDGVYTFVFTGKDDPASFTFTLLDAEGNELYNGAMQSEVNLELSAGEHLLLFTAEAAAELDFVVGIEAGSMTTDPDNPGELFNGATFLTEDVTEPLYARLTVESSLYPQRLGVLIQGGEGDVYQAELTERDGWESASISTDETDSLHITTTGGEYDLVVVPIEGGASLQVSIFLSGPAPKLELGVETEGELTGVDDADVYQFTVDEVGTEVLVTVAADATIMMNVGLEPGESLWYATAYEDATGELAFVAPHAGVYYLELTTDAEDGATYTVLFEEVGQAETLPLNEAVRGQVKAGSNANFIVRVEEPEQFVLVVVVGPDDSDIDLTLQRIQEGQEIAYDSSYLPGSREIVALYADEPSDYFVTVQGWWLAEDAEFVIMASTGAVTDLFGMVGETDAADENAAEDAAEESEVGEPTPKETIGALEQWVSAAEASSQYSDDAWSAQQVIGEPDTPEPGDFYTAWAARSSDAQTETLTLTFEQAVIPTAIEIYESYNPGAVARIEVLDPNTDEWVVVWEGVSDTVRQRIAIFSPQLQPVDFATNQVRLTIDEPSVPGWNEIDAVKLIGWPEN
ncbi:MAG: hypothetical protein NZ553_15040 [Caldilinea sp.]|nr:hypothetical protein [Caldilinea sp.]MDW8441788.1 hypothetical protein [Caldilineaceae bacterium]